MKKLLHKIKSIYKKIDFENLRTQIGISVLFGVLFGLIMGYYTYIQSKYRHRTDGHKKEMIKNIKVSKNYYKQFPESDNIEKLIITTTLLL